MTSNIINKKSVIENSLIYLKSFLLLMKPRVMSLVIFTCAVGLLTAPESVSFYKSIIKLILLKSNLQIVNLETLTEIVPFSKSITRLKVFIASSSLYRRLRNAVRKWKKCFFAFQRHKS